MDLLRATGGRFATDPYEFVTPINVIENHFYFDFLLQVDVIMLEKKW